MPDARARIGITAKGNAEEWLYLRKLGGSFSRKRTKAKSPDNLAACGSLCLGSFRADRM